MKHTKEMLLIKVEDLVPSPHNVRRYPAGQVEELAALIASQGLLQNLIVTEQAVGRGKRQQTKFGVVAGERRRRALVLLLQRKALDAGYEVPCELVSAERAVEISLAENSGREAMHRPTSSKHSIRSSSKAGASRMSQRASACLRSSCSAGSGWRRCRRSCWRCTVRTAPVSTS